MYRLREGMILKQIMLGAVRMRMTEGLFHIKIFFPAPGTPILTSSLNSSNNCFIPLGDFSMALLHCRDNDLADDSTRRLRN
jgi:hypothetical protein